MIFKENGFAFIFRSIVLSDFGKNEVTVLIDTDIFNVFFVFTGFKTFLLEK